MPRFDVVTFGETMIRLNPPGHELIETCHSLELRTGGSESNTAIALCRLGREVSWWSKLPDNSLGRRIEANVRRTGVDTSGVLWTTTGRAGLYFVEFGASPRAHHVTYDRADSAISTLQASEPDWSILDGTRHLHLTGITAALSESCAAAVERAAKEARRRNLTVSLDVNHRSKLWAADKARITLSRLMPMVDLLICPSGDAIEVFGLSGVPIDLARTLRATTNVPVIVVTGGELGVFAVTETQELHVPVIASEEIDRVGAGDAFDAGLLDGYLDDDLTRGLQMGAAMAALKRTIPGDELFVQRADVEALAAGIIDAKGISR
jgi:2-dehydro-3-deoxygluconokinase